MDPMRIAIRSVAAFLFLLVMVRLSGKQAVSQGTPFDFVLSLILGDLIDDLIFSEVPAAEFVAAVGVLVITDLLVKIACLHHDGLHAWVDGHPTILLRNGKPLSQSLRSEQLNNQDCLSLLRQKGFDEETKDQLKLMILEPSGEPSIVRKGSSKIAQKKDRDKLR
jgi:uncharacterized membrane protein YcaP (DUF421 family)